MDAYTKQESNAKYAMKQEYNIQSNNLLLIRQEVSKVQNGNHIFPYLQVAGQLAVGDAQQNGGTILLNGETLATTADVERATAAATAAQQSANEAAQSAQQANTAATNVINGLQPLAKVQIAAGQAVGAVRCWLSMKTHTFMETSPLQERYI